MYKVFIQNNSISFVDSNEIYDLDGIFLFEQLAIARKNYVLELLNLSSKPTKFYVVCQKPIKTMGEFFSDFERTTAAGGIVECNGKVLLIKRHGKWDFPKGKIEENESEEIAAMREITEETGVTNLTKVKQLASTLHTYSTYGPNTIKKTVWFHFQTDILQNGTPQNEEGITEVKWVEKSELTTYLANSYGSLQEVAKSF
ncbi:MAG TPA: NUDIX domain-containing protein [Crocinitomicaceae bacterium]|nr:NUDIX domain-containing protein [Crocinitomicaceae bacterium]